MKNHLKNLCSILLTISLIVSSFLIFDVSALDAEVDNQKDIEFHHCNGCIPITEDSESDPDISTVADYYEVVTDRKKTDIAAVGAYALPSSVDNSTSPYFPPIGDQGRVGACAVFSTTYYQFTYTMNKARNVPTTKDNTFSVPWIYNFVNGGKDKGSLPEDIYETLKEVGCPSNKSYPYNTKNYNCKKWNCDPEIWREAMRYRLKDYQEINSEFEGIHRITSPDDPDLLPIKTALSNGDILTFTSYINGWKRSPLKTNEIVPENDKYAGEACLKYVLEPLGEHGMTIVGYNDDIWCDINENNQVDKGEMGALKVANSYGKIWGNKGFMWVAYDALNKASVVDYVETQKDRIGVLTDVYRIDVCEAYEGEDIYAKFTLNTADRAQMSVNLSAEKEGSPYSSQFLNNIDYTNGAKCPFDGTKNACDATFVYPLRNLIPDLSKDNFESCDFNITIKDTNKDSIPLSIKDISIVNEYTGTEYKVTGDFPITVDGGEYSANMKETAEVNTVVYYIGFDNPTLHYMIGDSSFDEASVTASSFDEVSMIENYDRPGYMYKYVFKNTAEDIALFFSNENGETDDNNGEYYKAQTGVNCYNTPDCREPLRINDFTISNGIPSFGKQAVFDIDTVGGYAPYRYRYIMYALSTGRSYLFDYDHDHNKLPIYFYSSGDYLITIEVTDQANTTAKLSKVFETRDIHLQIESITCDKATGVVSEPMEFRCNALNKTNTTSRFIVKDNNGKVVWDETVNDTSYNNIESTSVTPFTYIPSKAGEYTLTVKATDVFKRQDEMTISFRVCDKLIGDADGSGNINVKDATIIQKYLSDIITQDDLLKTMADCNNDSKISIQDATNIQKYLADISNSGNTGELIEYTLPTYTITFTDTLNWGDTVYCYYSSQKNAANKKPWPGLPMTKAGVNEKGETIYTITVPWYISYITFSCDQIETYSVLYKGGDRSYYPIDNGTGNFYDLAEK